MSRASAPLSGAPRAEETDRYAERADFDSFLASSFSAL
jgi:hypothetical protein